MLYASFRLMAVSFFLLAACGRTDFPPKNGKDAGMVVASGGVTASGGSITSTGTGGQPIVTGTGGTRPLGHPWPMFGRDPQGTRRSPVDTSKNKGSLRWQLQLGKGQMSSPVVAKDGTIYVFSTEPALYAVAPDASGSAAKLAWRYAPGSSEIPLEASDAHSPAIGDDGTVYFGMPGTFYAVGAPAQGSQGNLKWVFSSPALPYEPLGSPTIDDDDTIYTVGSRLYVINGVKGALNWMGDASAYGINPPAIADDKTVYFGSRSLFAIKGPTSGAPGPVAWEFADAHVGSSPAIGADGTVFVGGDNLKASAFTLGGDGVPKLKWTFHTGTISHPAPAIGRDGTVYIAGYGWDLFALDPNTTSPEGELKWRWKHVDSQGLRSAPAVADDGTVYAAGAGSLFAISPPAPGGDGLLKWRYQTKGNYVSAPAIGADGSVYVTDEAGLLYAIQ